MTKRIFRSTLAVAVCVFLAAAVIITGVLYNYFSASMQNQLKSQLELAYAATEREGVSYLENLQKSEYRLTLIGADGKVIYDTSADAGAMDNHADRAEIRDAVQKGEGESERFSSTLLEKTFYRAKKLSNGCILRISATQYSVLTLVLGILHPIVIIFVFAVILSALLSRRMSKKIVEPLNSLDLEKPLENDVYDEISPLLLHIEQQNRRIKYQIDELKQNRKKFDAVIENMNEALILLDEDANVICANNSAMNLFNTDKSCIGKNFLLTDRSIDIDSAVKQADENGKSETSISRNGREYRVNVSKIGRRNIIGTVILAFDVTDKVFAERNRKEFTANVSHELKTPLQSVMGSAELIENGLVKTGDIPRFAKNIRTEAHRLVALIDDIIRLSALDEKQQLEFENVDLLEIAKSTAEELKPMADAEDVKISLVGENTVIKGVHRLVCEIVRNLCENAVKYNKHGGEVKISVKNDGNLAHFTVADTGIGISDEDISRVFERFYRVDKSHSKQTGGTGLGLSIVKHAADCLGAKVSIKSTLGEGTEITVGFPIN